MIWNEYAVSVFRIEINKLIEMQIDNLLKATVLL